MGDGEARRIVEGLDPEELIDTFLQAAALAHVPFVRSQVKHEMLPAPHKRPGALPPGSQAVYAFLLDNRCLKVGKAGPKTLVRFTSQHYGMNAGSTLARSILANPQRLAELLPATRRSEIDGLQEGTVGRWIERNTARLHVFLPTAVGALPLSLLE